MQDMEKRTELSNSQIEMGFNIMSFIVKETVTFAAALFLVVSIYHAIDVRRMVETTGVLTRYEPVVVRSGVWGGRPWEEVRVRMFVTHTVGGEPYEAAWPTFLGHADMLGLSVSFFYDPANPLRIRTTEDSTTWLVQLSLSFIAIVFLIGFMGLGCVTKSDAPWLPYIIIKVFELGGASFAVWQWLSPATNAPVMLIGVLIAALGIVASTIENFNPAFFSGLSQENTPEETLEKTLFAQLVSIKNEGGQFALQFRDRQGQTYSFFTPDAPNAAENSTCTLTLKGGYVSRFAPLSSRKLD